MKKPNTLTRCRNGNVRNGQLTIGLDVGDRSSFYCVLNERGEVILEARVATTPVQSLIQPEFAASPSSAGVNSPRASVLKTNL
jgi:transposase